MTNKTIQSDGYPVCIGSFAFDQLNELLERQDLAGEKFILVDENTSEHCLPILLQNCPALQRAEIIEIESGEVNKNIEITHQIWQLLSAYKASRKAVMINLGGGVITDMGGFIASTYKRGIAFINVPTTLLSQVDASVGGKLGIDLIGNDIGTLKNQIGVFNYPEGVFVFPPFIDTLPEREVLSGFAEIIKHALIEDKAYWEQIKALKVKTTADLYDLIGHSIDIKNEIVLADPKENGKRKLLNFGHTIGHAIESFSHELETAPLAHGEAIAIGMICEAFIAMENCGLDEQEFKDLTQFILKLYPKFPVNKSNYPRLLELMGNDKKNDSETDYNFTLLASTGEGTYNEKVNNAQIIAALDHYNQLVQYEVQNN